MPARFSQNSRFLVIGAGRSGIAATKLLLREGMRVVLYDQKPLSDLKYLGTLPLEHHALTTYFNQEPVLKENDVAAVVLSPGVSLDHFLVQWAHEKSIPVLSEIDLATFYLCAQKVIGITGTNGKSTTTVMLATILNTAGFRAIACGNLGTPLCDIALINSDCEIDYLVVELSSFQLEILRLLKLDCAIIVNITPDHLDRYPSFDAYKNAKYKIASLVKENGVLLTNANLSHEGFLVKNHQQFCVDGSQRQRAFFTEGNIYGEHNHENALAATMAAQSLGLSSKQVILGLNSFNALPHRCERVANKNGVTFINDSKGTTVVAVKKALSMSNKDTYLLLGGIEKGEDFSLLGPHNFPQIKGYYVFGQAKQKIMNGIDSHLASAHENLEDAFWAATKHAHEGDIVLLSPGCASYDQFDDYQHRGEVFKELVSQL